MRPPLALLALLMLTACAPRLPAATGAVPEEKPAPLPPGIKPLTLEQAEQVGGA